ncbi:hypothetical protein PVAND_014371 [Polypedilum vanderplanki]|uniref:Mos1 transposase HTH domain-containing protein n=1 Tax=Polypedilum vanderplanki TaxID=319348 RepID=A0A9J6B9R2_POLVA|nr:hypothetical protein PVAND_014371 [Polypedilum vanderplanki]
MKNSKIEKDHIRHLLLFNYNKGMKARAAFREIDKVYPGSISVVSAIRWFKKFREGDLSLKRKEGTGKEKTFSDDDLKLVVKSNPYMTLNDFAAIFDVTKSCLSKRMKVINFTNKNTLWVPHVLSNKNKCDRLTICMELLKRYQEENFLDYIVTGDETWVLYENVAQRREWSERGEIPGKTAKAGLHPKKILLSLWWDVKGIIYLEFLNRNETINAIKYQQQLRDLREALALSRPSLFNRGKVHFHHDNARPHTARDTVALLKSFEWNIIPQAPYSPDLAPSDYYLFTALKNALKNKKFTNDNELKDFVKKFFASKEPTFYKKGIYKLPSLWQSVVNCGGDYAK